MHDSLDPRKFVPAHRQHLDRFIRFCGAEGRDQRTEGHRQTDRQTDTRATHTLKQPVRETDHATSGHLVIVIVYHCTFYF